MEEASSLRDLVGVLCVSPVFEQTIKLVLVPVSPKIFNKGKPAQMLFEAQCAFHHGYLLWIYAQVFLLHLFGTAGGIPFKSSLSCFPITMAQLIENSFASSSIYLIAVGCSPDSIFHADLCGKDAVGRAMQGNNYHRLRARRLIYFKGYFHKELCGCTQYKFISNTINIHHLP